MFFLRSSHICIGFILFLTSCNILKNSPKYGFVEGYYRSHLFHKKDKKIYVVPTEDSIKIYSAKSLKKGYVDTSKILKIAFPQNEKPLAFKNYLFRKKTLDIDAITIPLKFRPAVDHLPGQAFGGFSSAVYLGYRSDFYHLSYSQTPLKVFKRDINHYGYSFGLFTGIGTANINENNTDNDVIIAYDGVVNISGINLSIGVQKFRIGLAAGFDHLFGKNRKHWVYQGKPWIGFSFGLNLH